MTLDEHKRELRVIDQCVSMHWSIAERHKRRALWLSIGLLLSSAILCGLTFVDEATLAFLGFTAQSGKVTIALASVAIFGLSIIELRVDWGGVARIHADAAGRLSRLKSKYRQAKDIPASEQQATWLKLSEESIATFADLPEIPNSQFAGLKGEHLFKVELSKELDKHPRVPAFLLKCKLRYLGLRGMMETPPPSPNEPPLNGR